MRRLLVFIVFGGLFGLVPIGAVVAATTQVDCEADSTALSPAVAAAAAGDTLAIRGTCIGQIVIDKDLVLRGKGGATIDGDGVGPVVVVTPAVTVELRKLTITGGVAQGPLAVGGIDNSGDLTLNKSTVTANVAHAVGFLGGGVYNAAIGGIASNPGATLTLFKSEVADNTATATTNAPPPGGVGGVIDVIATSAISNFLGTMTLTKSEVSDNEAFAEVGAGGEGVAPVAQTIGSFFGPVTMDRVEITDNAAEVHGATEVGFANAAMNTVAGPTVVTDSVVRGNAAEAVNGDAVGGISFSFTAAPSAVTSSKVVDNEASAQGASATGGIEVFLGDSTLLLADLSVKGNEADSDFAAVGGVKNFTEANVLTIEDTKVKGNEAQSGGFPAVGGLSSFDPGLGGFDPADIALLGKTSVKKNEPTQCDFGDPACA